MNKITTLILFTEIAVILSALSVMAQTSTPFLPSYVPLAGISYDYYGKTGFAAQTTVAVKVTNQASTVPLYSFSTLDLTRDAAVLRTGAAYILLQQGRWSIVGLGDAGLATGVGPALGAFSGGGFLAYDVGARVSGDKSHFYIAFGGRVLNITSQTVQPIYTITLGPGFGK